MNEQKFKTQQFESFKAEVYQTYGNHPKNLFTFFYENNDLFKQIDEDDMLDLKKMHLTYRNRTFNYFSGAFLAVLLIDQVVFRFALPTFRIKHFRFPLFLFKYIGVPLLAWKFCDKYRVKDIEQIFEDKTMKYNFNFEDFNRVMAIVERAFNVGKMKELFEKRNKFDWSQVPELK